MKISKQPRKSVKSCSTVEPALPDISAECSVAELSANPKEQARCYIQSAISALTPLVDSDIIAKESLANLAVVYFDLQSK